MKKFILAILVFGTQHVFAQSALVCNYRVESSRGVSDVTLRFGLNMWGKPADGSISIVRSDGSASLIRIPRRDIRSLMLDEVSIPGALIANVHVRSYEVDLILNYMDSRVRQLSGNVRWNGELVKFASTEIDCLLVP